MRQHTGPHHFHTKLVGVTHDNDDGSSRPQIIRRCKVGERLTLDHQEHNQYSDTAVAVLRSNGQQLGFLRDNMGAEFIAKSNAGYRFAVFISDITGGAGGRNLGVNVLVVGAPPESSDAEAQEYINKALAEDPNSSLSGAVSNASGGSGCATVLCAVVAVALPVWCWLMR